MLLKLGLQTPEPEPLSWSRTRETWAVNADKAMEGLRFYGRGVQLIVQVDISPISPLYLPYISPISRLLIVQVRVRGEG